ncbi:hypothetical protein DJ010_00890 [Nocardioides silvaticus]|uniref:GTPase-associated protein 1 N-terminal domain-containing protein n=1 Tax=Nocardioides silvaticus TaxID=2201891 RepID=A0A316TPT0_9ACTN|nr:hypothetical protein [Nocardioides silvaticus]PWN04242.1 hypothetical protein DJ010_00890 [Nocardioides silvaticus]
MTWYELTYAAGRAGWEVQAATRGTPRALEKQMRAGVTTRLELLAPLVDFPSTAELSTRIRRLTFRYFDEGGSVWWHAVEAGKDATGRPGNVFTHAVGRAGLSRTLRPIDLWHSNLWLTPFGPREVDETVLGRFEAPRTSGRAAAIERALSRQEETEALLAAAGTCRERGWSLVLASESQEEFVAWLAVVCHFTAAPVAAGSFPFSTFERAARMQSILETDAVIVFIPSVDLGEAKDLAASQPQRTMLVLDLADLPAAPSGGEWEHAGQRWPAEGLWQDAFFELTDAGRYGPADLDRVLGLMDDIADGGDDYLDVGEPLALAILEDLEDESRRDDLLLQWGARLGPPRRVDEASDDPSGLDEELGPVRVADAPLEVQMTVQLPAADVGRPEDAQLARAVVRGADALAVAPDTVGRVERWLADYEEAHRATGRLPDDLDTEKE